MTATAKTITKQWTEALLAAVKERAPHIEWSTITAGGAAIIGALPHGEGSVLVFQYSPNAYTLRHNGRMVRSDLTSIEDICDAIASLANKSVLRAG
jgi:hypothetical protein